MYSVKSMKNSMRCWRQADLSSTSIFSKSMSALRTFCSWSKQHFRRKSPLISLSLSCQTYLINRAKLNSLIYSNTVCVCSFYLSFYLLSTYSSIRQSIPPSFLSSLLHMPQYTDLKNLYWLWTVIQSMICQIMFC